MKKSIDKKKLLLRSEMIRDLNPISTDSLRDVAGGSAGTVASCTWTKVQPDA